jgi:hypothetical protein
LAADLYTRFASRRDYASLDAHGTSSQVLSDWKPAALIATCALAWCLARILGHTKVASFIYFQF